MYAVTLIPGDGTGPELCAVARDCIEATGVAIRWDVQPAGAAAMERHGTPIPAPTLDSIRRNRVALKGPLTTPPGSRSVSVALRQELDLYACARPCRHYAGVRSFFRGTGVDILVIRENTEDLYAGFEFESGQPDTDSLVDQVQLLRRKRIRAGTAIALKLTSELAVRRIVQFAFAYARKLGRKKVTVVHKANLLKHTDGLYLASARDVARDFPDIELEDRLIDALCLQLMQRPEHFDVLVMPNLYGDIVSDLVAGMVGGIGVAPAANIGDRAAIFEAIHGSATKYKGQNKVNPTALILAGTLLLKHLGEANAALRLERAVTDVIREGKYVTYDLKPRRDDPSAVGTRQMADAILARIERAN